MSNLKLLILAFWQTVRAMGREIRTMPKGYYVVMIFITLIGNIVQLLLK